MILRVGTLTPLIIPVGNRCPSKIVSPEGTGTAAEIACLTHPLLTLPPTWYPPGCEPCRTVTLPPARCGNEHTFRMKWATTLG